MKKTLLVTAVAASMAATAAQAATVYEQDGAKVDLYGNIQMAYTSATDGNGDSSAALNDNGTTLGISAEREINDLVAYLKLEMDDFKADEMKTANDADDSGDQAYVGLKGGFGDIRIGSYDGIYNNLIDDAIDGAWYLGPTDSPYSGETDQIRYASPVFSGFQVMVASNIKGDGEETAGTSVIGSTQTGGDPVLATTPGDNADTNSFVFGAQYSMDRLTLAAAYDDLGNREGTTDFGDSYGVAAHFDLTSTFTLSGKADFFAGDGTNADQTRYGFKGNYNYGSGNVYGALQSVDVDNADERTEVMVGASYALSSAVYYFVESTMYDRANDQGDFVSTGLFYSF